MLPKNKVWYLTRTSEAAKVLCQLWIVGRDNSCQSVSNLWPSSSTTHFLFLGVIHHLHHQHLQEWQDQFQEYVPSPSKSCSVKLVLMIARVAFQFCLIYLLFFRSLSQIWGMRHNSDHYSPWDSCEGEGWICCNKVLWSLVSLASGLISDFVFCWGMWRGGDE